MSTLLCTIIHRFLSFLCLIVFTSQVFAYDYCFWSMDETDKDKFAG